MKLSEFLDKLSLIDAAKPYVADFRAEAVGLPGDINLKDLAARISKGDADATALADLNKTVKELDGKVKDVEPLKAKVTAYEKTISDGLLQTAFNAKAGAAGVKPTALTAAFKLANLAAAKVDIDKKDVTGITQDIFDGLKKDHDFLFEPVKTAKDTVPPLPGSGGDVAPQPTGLPGGWMGHLMRAQELNAAEKN